MTRYRVTISHDACTTHDVEAGSPESAAERAMEGCGSVTLCHHCSDELQMGDPIRAACVENLDDGTHIDAVDPEVAALQVRVAELEAAAPQPLTEEEVSKILLHCHAIPPGVSLVRLNGDIMDFVETMTAFARAIERAHGIGLPASKPGATK